ncbi:uncharacterized protein LOC129741675 [Uranotaenia lowii]|uniref:uncharacterized protein LOC129741675 n=1 Tax=Uranotaenia lowii TaxID=190385 RepID=UPI002479BD44|nr:uncharacterized protein LOC129741675 [Uranotaenia lowii]
MPQRTLKSSLLRLRNLMTSFQGIYTYMQNYDDQRDARELASRLERLDSLWEKIDEAMAEVEEQSEEEEEERYVKERLDFQNKFFELKGFLQSKMREYPVSSASLPVNESIFAATSHPHVKLPLISLPKFSGNIEEWLSFRDLYLSLIHHSEDLPVIEKYHYLRSQLEGEALSVISSLALTQANYTVAWDLLVKRYSNSKALKRKQVQNLFELPFIKRESAFELQALVEGFEKATKVLDQVVQIADYKDLLLIHLLCSRFDEKTRRSWEEHTSTKEEETLKDLVEFLHRRIQILDSLPGKPSEQHPPPIRKAIQSKVTNHGAFHTPPPNCVCCSENHPLFTCSSFEKLSVGERESVLRQHNLCRNCFRRGHQARDCKSKFSCRRCKGRHHTLVCYKAAENSKSTPSDGNTPKRNGNPNPQAGTSNATISSNIGRSARKVLLATAVVLLEDDYGNSVSARALLDSGSECNIISSHFSQLLRFKRNRADVQISGIGQFPTNTKEKVRAMVRSKNSNYAQIMDFYVLPKVTEDLPTSSFSETVWNLPKGITLADPEFFRTHPIDVLLGGEFFFNFFSSKQRLPLGNGLPSLIDSVFGWLVTGSVANSKEEPILCKHSTVLDSLENLMAKFWECENGSRTENYSVEETQCEKLYLESIKRGKDGRYTVALPKCENALNKLGDSKTSAMRRFLNLEKRLSSDENLKNEYHAFMTEYLNCGHMGKADNLSDSTIAFYLPHHPVIKSSSTTTRVRVVFDASSRSSSGTSLNDILLNGPVVQDDLRTLIMRSRFFPIVLIADVEKMFRQIWIDPKDYPLQRIFWRFSSEAPIETYELRTVTYGTKSAPYLATRTLKQLSDDEVQKFPLAACRLSRDVYMDDLITGINSTTEAKKIRLELDELALSGGFKLRKWASNLPEVLEGVIAENLAIPLDDGIDFERDRTVKTLGLVWEPKSDELRFNFEISPIIPEELTKRKILSNIAKIFDPLGLLGPVVTSAKIFMQLIWEQKNKDGNPIGWDELLPQPLTDWWTEFYSLLPNLKDLRIPRFVGLASANQKQLHCFSDASEKAYGACMYLVSKDPTGKTQVSLVSSKSRVSPLKRQTIPRLELCGALLAAELYVKVLESMEAPLETYFWTDSRTVLQWLAQTPSTWTTFVANRVSSIQNFTQNCTWKHVPGIMNPADQLSRGLNAEQIVTDQTWWTGPPWLAQDSEHWPNSINQPCEENVHEEERRKVVGVVAENEGTFNDWYFGHFKCYFKLLRVTVLCRRYLYNLGKPAEERIKTTRIKLCELIDAEKQLVRLVQKEVFSSELKDLRKSGFVHRSSRLRWLVPMVREDGILCIGGRLEHSDLSTESKHPMIIPGNHQFSNLLAEIYHIRLLHAGPQLMLSSMRLKFWPLSGRDLCRRITHQCLTCFRMKPKLQQQFMGQLPSPRIQASRAFTHTGVDYFGPVYIRQGYRKAPIKAYVAVFVCFSTKAVHLELVSDLSTAKFVQALRRFIGRRGKCATLYSDNGTNFVGARNQLKELLKTLRSRDHHDEMQQVCSEEGIDWQLNPPSAPHFGGLWEAAVRSAKKHLLRVLGNSSASHEDFETLLVQVEACLNSRPLTQLSDDPKDFQPLTPAHFLIGSSIHALPEKDLSSTPENRLKQYQLMQQQLQRFWRRWHIEYLTQLQPRVKNWQPPIKIEPGRLVIIVDENQPPMKWKMARIHQVHPGNDGVTRVVTLRTSNGYMTRPVTKICMLPIPTNDGNVSSGSDTAVKTTEI